MPVSGPDEPMASEDDDDPVPSEDGRFFNSSADDNYPML